MMGEFGISWEMEIDMIFTYRNYEIAPVAEERPGLAPLEIRNHDRLVGRAVSGEDALTKIDKMSKGRK